MRPPRQPAHTRTLTVRLAPAPQRRVAVEARLLDVRKRGVVRVAGRLNGPGVVHDLSLRLLLSAGGEHVVDAELAMASVPFPSDARTGGEGCRDNERRATGLVGLSLRAGFLSGLHRVMGGARGCFHVFTLMRLVAATTHRVVRRADPWDAVFTRALTVDATWSAEGLTLQGTLTDVAAVAADGLERLLESFEGNAALDAVLPDFEVAAASAAWRTADRAWVPTSLDALRGSSLARGYGLKLGDALPSRGALAPLHDLLLMMQPVAFQAMPAVPGDEAPAEVRPRRPSVARDSCVMWREDGPLVRGLAEEARGGTH